ncbi:serine/threonine-protein kinase [Aggregatilinea lenta]|uniref:serine/threonine-protein kinase n=1 Tax=Aggregatilinea lenta TaxID=913108 RepID=UPI000E5BD389|nr:serine/threonine-protein kinase [Aggregatilinea lenta]
MANDLFANLSLHDPIGAGFFGTVYEGNDPVQGKVAVKVLTQKEDESDERWNLRKATLLNEGQRLKDAEHDHVVRVYGLLESTHGSEVYLVMEYCENGSLQQCFERGPMQLRPLRKYLTEAALGLQAIHAREMIHRDLKPSNILLDSSDHAKIADFGLVTNDLLLGYGSGQGYADHLAKEVYETGLTSVRTDVFAFGMTAYRLLHGEEFYSEQLPPRQLIRDGGFPGKLKWLPNIPQEWRRFIRKALHDDTNSRLQSASEILNKLAAMPVEPDWECTYSPEEVVWQHWHRSRRIEVRWQGKTLRTQSWSAISYPHTTTGRTRRLDGSAAISKGQAIRELERFFAGYRS